MFCNKKLFLLVYFWGWWNGVHVRSELRGTLVHSYITHTHWNSILRGVCSIQCWPRTYPEVRAHTTELYKPCLHVVHAGMLGLIPWTYRTYPDLVSSPPKWFPEKSLSVNPLATPIQNSSPPPFNVTSRPECFLVSRWKKRHTWEHRQMMLT